MFSVQSPVPSPSGCVRGTPKGAVSASDSVTAPRITQDQGSGPHRLNIPRPKDDEPLIRVHKRPTVAPVAARCPVTFHERLTVHGWFILRLGKQTTRRNKTSPGHKSRKLIPTPTTMASAYITYPNPHFSVRVGQSVQSRLRHQKPGRRVYVLTPATISRCLEEFVNGHVTFNATPEYNDAWIEADFGDERFEEELIRYLQRLLGRRYKPRAEAVWRD